jgi:membrane protease YdiL (CAAX protease family)
LTSNELIASKRHTAGALILIFAYGILGRVLVTNRPAALLENSRVSIYLGALAIEWLVFLYVRSGVRARGARTVRQIVDQSPWTLYRWLFHVGIAVGIGLAWMACGVVFGKLLGANADDIRHLLSLIPKGPVEKLCWVVLSVSAGFCEEFVYRGYLQQQFHRLTGSLSAGVLFQAIMFGVAHVSLPWQIALSVTVLALLLGSVAAWRKSLVPGMVFHVWFDGLAGVLAG